MTLQVRPQIWLVRIFVMGLVGIFTVGAQAQLNSAASQPRRKPVPHSDALRQPKAPLRVAVFAGGCFWCMESGFEKIPGVRSVISGYTGGAEKKPAYYEVARGKTGHQEAVWVVYHPSEITYERLLDIFWRQIDPTQNNGQFADLGPQYETVIFTNDPQEQKMAQASKLKLQASKKFGERVIVTRIEGLGSFWPAEIHHQDYYRLHPLVYKRYFEASGRGPFVRKHWGAQEKDQK